MKRANLKVARYKAGFSQEALAERLGVTRNTVSQWERGITTPYPFYLQRLCEALKVQEPADLGIHYQHNTATVSEPTNLLDPAKSSSASSISRTEPENITSESPQDGANSVREHEGENLKQADIVDLTLYPDSNILLGTQPLNLLSASSDPLSDDDETLNLLEQLTAICWELSKGSNLETAGHILWSYLPKVVSHALPPSRHQQRLAAIASQGYLLAAALAGHRDNLHRRQFFSEQALLHANTARDRNLQVAALRQLAATFDYLDRPHNVLQTYQQALPYLGEVSLLLQSCIYAGLSGSYAQLKQKQEAEQFMGLAYECFPTKPEADPCFLYTNGGYHTLIFCEGLTYLDFHQPLQAETTFGHIDGLQPKAQLPEKAHIELLNYQAETFIELKKMEQACVYLEKAINLALKIGSKRRYNESTALFMQMSSIWKNEARVKSLGDLFQIK